MYSLEQKKRAIELLIKYDGSIAAVIRKLGYPNRQTLYNWIHDYQSTGAISEHGEVFNQKQQVMLQNMQVAVNYYLEHGKSLSKTIRALGFPKSRETLKRWIDELAPGKRYMVQSQDSHKCSDVKTSTKFKALFDLSDEEQVVREISERYGVERTALYHWRAHLQKDAIITRKGKRKADSVTPEEKLKKVEEELAAKEALLKSANEEIKSKIKQIEELEFELDVRQATMELLKKDLGGDPNRLNNQEKTLVINALRNKWGLGKLLKRFMIAKSSYEYQVKVLGSKAHTLSVELKEKVRAAFEKCQGIYGYRRLLAEINDGVSDSDRISEWVLRKCLRALNLTAKRARKRKKYSSYVGEVSIAPENTCLDDRGKHDFRSDAPNKLWITDITEFAIGAGKVYLSPIIDCFDGMPISWSIGTSPNAELANSSLLAACKQLQVGESPRIHSDRGGHYRWGEWIDICKRYNLTRSMSRKGHSPDNSRCEGFFGRLKVEFFYGENWRNISIEEFICELNNYLVWYRDSRRKSDLGYISPLQYRQQLGLAA